MARPSAPPARPMSRLSATIWPTTRARVAPSAVRTASSWRRPISRAISRFMMLAQASTSSSPTTVKSSDSTSQVLAPAMASRVTPTRAVQSRLVSGCSRARRCAIAATCASRVGEPGAVGRAGPPARHWRSLRLASAGSTAIGTHRSISDWLPSSIAGDEHADDGVRAAVEQHVAAEHGVGAAVAGRPEAVAERDHPGGARAFVGARSAAVRATASSPHRPCRSPATSWLSTRSERSSVRSVAGIRRQAASCEKAVTSSR